jgi:membrane protease YdiL (CAAX protease family)
MADPVAVLPTEPPSGSPSAPAWKAIFVGPNGIRAIWRVLMFGVAAVAFSYLLGAVVRFLFPGTTIGGFTILTPRAIYFSHGTLFLLTSCAALIMAKIERRKYGDYGLPFKSAFGKDFWIGNMAGFVAISGALLGIFALHGFRVTGLAIHGNTILSATIAWCIAMVLVGLGEEFAYRGYLQFTLTTGMGFWPSAILLSALFGFSHGSNPGETKLGQLSVVIFGLLFCLFLRRTGNLWWAVGFHAGWDWGQTFFYGVRDSGIPAYHYLLDSSFTGPQWLTGGSVGPEASIFTPIALGIVAIVFSCVYRETRYRPGKIRY